MKTKTLSEIANAIHGELFPKCAGSKQISRVSVDSRKINKGELFFALNAIGDGHDYVESSIISGAVAAVVSKHVQSSAPEILVNDTLKALGDLAANYRCQLMIPFICVTGSLGKTTTRALISHCLETKYVVAQSPNNFNNLIGLPLSIIDIEENHDVAVLELGINTFGEMRRLGEISRPNFAVILNVAPVHIEGLSTVENIAKEKLELLKHIQDDGIAFINADDPLLINQTILPSSRVRTFGCNKDADFRIENFEPLENGRIAFEVNGVPFQPRLLGEGIAYSTASAVAVCSEFGIQAEDITEHVESFSGFPGRLTLREHSGIKFIEDYYNASPLAMKHALRVLSSMKAPRKIAILGDMLELGRDEVRYHIEIGAFAGELGIDALYLFGELMANAVQPAITAGISADKVFHTQCFDELIYELKKNLMEGDLVLVKASRSMHFERIIAELEGTCAVRD